MTVRLLLDTHALLWTLLEPDRIPVVTCDRALTAFPGIRTIW